VESLADVGVGVDDELDLGVRAPGCNGLLDENGIGRGVVRVLLDRAPCAVGSESVGDSVESEIDADSDAVAPAKVGEMSREGGRHRWALGIKRKSLTESVD
jgi:hypothetical protein